MRTGLALKAMVPRNMTEDNTRYSNYIVNYFNQKVNITYIAWLHYASFVLSSRHDSECSNIPWIAMCNFHFVIYV